MKCFRGVVLLLLGAVTALSGAQSFRVVKSTFYDPKVLQTNVPYYQAFSKDGGGYQVSQVGGVPLLYYDAPYFNADQLTKYSATGTVQWTRLISIGDVLKVVEGRTGVFVAGHVVRNFPKGPVSPGGGLQNYLSKYDLNGNLLFIRYFGNSFQTIGMELDSADNAYLTDVRRSYSDGKRPAVFKFSPQGTQLWQADVADSDTYLQSMHVDAAGNVYLAGNSHPPYQTEDPITAVATVINTFGQRVWEYRLFDPAANAACNGFELSRDGYAIASFSLYNGSSYEPSRIQKFSPSGAVVWTTNLLPAPASIQVDSSGNTYAMTSQFPNRIISKIDSSGIILWSKSIEAYEVVGFDTANNLLLDNGSKTEVATEIGAADPNGNLLWKKTLWTSPFPENRSVTIGSEGFIYWLDSSPNNPTAEKLSAAGAIVWIGTGPSTEHTSAPLLFGATSNLGTTFLAGNQSTAAFSASGQLKWEIPALFSAPGREYPVLCEILPTPSDGFVARLRYNISQFVWQDGIKQFDANGNLQWSATLAKGAEPLVMDTAGNVFCFDGLLKKFSPTGALLWSLDLGAGATLVKEPYPYRQTLWMSLTPSGQVLVVRDNVDYFVWKVAPSGSVTWSAHLPKVYGTDVPVDIDGDSAGNAYLTTSSYSQGTTLGHITKLSGSGVTLWNTDLLVGDNSPVLVTRCYNGKLYSVGNARVNGTQMVAAFCVDATSGGVDWARPINPGLYSEAKNLHIDEASNHLNVVGLSYTNDTSNDYFVAGIDLSGNVDRMGVFDSGYRVQDRYSGSGEDGQNNLFVYARDMGPSDTYDYHITKLSRPPADWASIELPAVVAKMATGTSYSGTVRVMNMGLNTWTATGGYKLDCVQPSTWSLTSVPLASGDSIAPGQSKVFSFTVTAPSTPGAYPLTFRMEHSGTQFDNASASYGIQVMTQTNFASFVGQTIPTAMVAGQSYAVSIQYKNTGSNTWTPGTGYKLQSVNPLNNTTWGMNRLALLNSSVAPGATGTFSGTVIAPMTSGTYNFQWQPIQDTTGLAFGSPSTNVAVTVTNVGDAARYISKTGAVTVNAGADFYVQNTMMNVGSNSWKTSTGYSLRALYGGWGAMNMYLPGSLASVPPGTQATFTKLLTAPLTPGTYPMQWQMLHGSTLFGDKTPYLNMNVVQGPYNAKFNSQTVISTSVAAGTTFGCTFSMQNLGTTTWDSTVKLASMGSNSFGVPAIAVSGTVVQNANASFTATFTAPTTPGTYTFQFRMQSPSGTFFGQPTTPVTIVVTAADAAQYLSKTGPLIVNAGSDFWVQNTFRNTGTSTWSSATGFSLRSVNPNDNLTWDRNRIYLPGTGSVAPGGTVTPTGPCTAPSVPGTYTMQWQMNHGATLFGEKTPLLTITVVQSADNAIFLTQSVVPVSVPTNSNFTVNLAMQNAGTGTWGAGYNLVPIGSSAWGVVPIASGAVPPDGQHTFTATCTAPNTPGTYTLQFRMKNASGVLFGQATKLVTITVQPDASQFVSNTGPLTVNAGADFDVQYNFLNTGSTIWTYGTGYQAITQSPGNNTTWRINRMLMSTAANVTPGTTGTFTGICTAPLTPGAYTMQWQVSKGGIGFGERSPLLTINVVQSADNAKYLSQSVVPISVAAGSTFTVNTSMQNMGTATWGTGYSLTTLGPIAWGVTGIASGSVAPGGQHTFTATCTAPSTPGIYTFQMRMNHNGTKFGERSPLITIEVT